MLTAIVLGILTGLILGITGAGGGILAVPALVVGLGFDMVTAAPVALIAVGMAALVGATDGLRKHQVRYKAAILMAIMGALCSGIGVWIAHSLSQQLLATLFALIMLFIATRMLRSRRNDTGPATAIAYKPCQLSPKTGRLHWTPQCATTLAAIGSVTGIFAGMLGVGGGFIIVPAFKRFTDIELRSIVATSLMLIALISLSTAAGSILRGVSIPALAWLFVGAAIIGMLLGRRVSAHLPERQIQLAFATVTIVVAGVLLVQVWT